MKSDDSHVTRSPHLLCIKRLSCRSYVLLLIALVAIEVLVVLIYAKSYCEYNIEISNNYEERQVKDYVSSEVTNNFGHLPHGKHARRRLPHFIIIGVKKCGTRALLNFLNIHPDIVTASFEVHFFDEEQVYKKGLEWYRKQMPFSYQDQLVGEKSPSYYRITDVPERIYKMNSSIKLILVVREPIERSISNYLQLNATQPGYDLTFDQAVLNGDGEVDSMAPCVFNSDYNQYIDNWLRWFPLKQISVVDGQLLIKSPHVVMEQVQSFLGLRHFITEEFFKYDEKKGFFCYYNFSNNLRCLGNSKGRPHPPINPETRAKLSKYFAPRTAMFFSKINASFDWNSV